jgi:DNA-binding NarL/FixJ family response regulator
MKAISVLLAEDHAVVRQGLRSLLSAEPDILVVGEAADGWEAVHLAQELLPDVIVMDLAMPQLNGVAAIRQIFGLGLPSRLLVLSSYADDEYVEVLTDEGVCGYLVKQTAADDLIIAVREASMGRPFFSPAISRRQQHRGHPLPADGRPAPQRQAGMSKRGREVLKLVAGGHVNRQIAGILGISVKTVEKHRQQLMNGLGIHDIAGLTRYAVAHGIIERGVPARADAELLAG